MTAGYSGGTKMNGYERIVTALKLGTPDYVPIMEPIIHENVIEALCPGGGYFDLVDRLDLDGVCVGEGHIGGQSVAPGAKGIREEETVSQWGVRSMRTAEAYHPVEGPIRSEADLERYTPPDPNDEDMEATVGMAVRRFKGKRFILYHCGSDFMRAAVLREHGLSDLLIDFVDNPTLAHGVMSLTSDYYCVLARRAIEAGADGVIPGDDWAHNTGPFMSPAQFREFVLPYFERMVQTCKEAGAFVIKHSDGNIWSLMDMIAASGIDAINPVQPDAGMDLAEMKRRYGSRLCLAGNINCGYTLSEAPVDQVDREVKEAIHQAGPGGGYIMMSSNSLHSSVRPENYKAMVEATRAYGKYPLS